MKMSDYVRNGFPGAQVEAALLKELNVAPPPWTAWLSGTKDGNTSPCKREEEIRQEKLDKDFEMILAKMALYNLLNLEYPYEDNPHFDEWACDCVVHGRRINARPTTSADDPHLLVPRHELRKDVDTYAAMIVMADHVAFAGWISAEDLAKEENAVDFGPIKGGAFAKRVTELQDPTLLFGENQEPEGSRGKVQREAGEDGHTE